MRVDAALQPRHVLRHHRQDELFDAGIRLPLAEGQGVETEDAQAKQQKKGDGEAQRELDEKLHDAIL
ncbi:MAG TPA: hypothetical protein DCF93_13070 [Desulfuromonas sp.]|nr:hypothetical protein [Desulfuromonas sp.]